MWQYNHTDELMHYGVLGMKWGVRRYRNEDGSLTRAGKRRQKIIDKEIELQNKKIEQYKNRSKAYRESVEEIRKKGPDELRKNFPGISEKTINEAVNTVIKRRETEARWNEHLAKHFEIYNKKLSELDITDVKMGRLKIHMYIQILGKETANNVNSTWKEDE